MNAKNDNDFDLDLSEEVDFSEGGEFPDIDDSDLDLDLEEPRYGIYVIALGILLLLIVIPAIIGVIIYATSQGAAARDFAATEQQVFATNTGVAKAIAGTKTAKAWTATPSDTPTPTSTSTNTFTPTFTATFTSTLTPSVTLTPTLTPSVVPSATLTPVPSDTPSTTPTPLSPPEMTATTFTRVSTQIAATLTAAP